MIWDLVHPITRLGRFLLDHVDHRGSLGALGDELLDQSKKLWLDLF